MFAFSFFFSSFIISVRSYLDGVQPRCENAGKLLLLFLDWRLKENGGVAWASITYSVHGCFLSASFLPHFPRLAFIFHHFISQSVQLVFYPSIHLLLSHFYSHFLCSGRYLAYSHRYLSSPWIHSKSSSNTAPSPRQSRFWSIKMRRRQNTKKTRCKNKCANQRYSLK